VVGGGLRPRVRVQRARGQVGDEVVVEAAGGRRYRGREVVGGGASQGGRVGDARNRRPTRSPHSVSGGEGGMAMGGELYAMAHMRRAIVSTSIRP
jgi:hypothetical protein